MIAYLTLKEAMLELPLGYRTIYNAVRRGEITAYKPGREILVERASLENWLLSKKIEPPRQVGRPRKNSTRRTA